MANSCGCVEVQKFRTCCFRCLDSQTIQDHTENLKYQDKDSEVYKEYIFGDDKDIKMILVDERHLRKQKHGDFRDTDLYQMRFGVQIPTGP